MVNTMNERRNVEARNGADDDDPTPLSPFARAIGRSRFVVIIAVAAVMIVALSLFLLGTMLAAVSVWHAWKGVFEGQIGSTDLTVEFLEVVSVMLKAVVFYIIGVGLYSLFIAPLNLTVALGVETLNDLESKVISVVIVILGVTFLEHFIRWEQPLETLHYGGALALVVSSLVLFQMLSHRSKQEQKAHQPDVQARAKREMFHKDHEQQEILPDEISGTNKAAQSADGEGGD
jgi:uncharacterized membrane protein YqhA